MELFSFAIYVTSDKRQKYRRFKEGLNLEILTTVIASWYTELRR